jgi:hypothetical protein
MKKEAIYRKHPLDSLNGNPLTEAIEVIAHEDELNKKLTFKPTFEKNLTDIPAVYQQVFLERLEKVHVPAPYLYGMYNKFVGLILDGYSKYTPHSAETNKLQMAIALAARKGERLEEEFISRTTAPSVFVHGHSGVGKTKGIRSVLNVIPQVIKHNKFEDKIFRQDQLVWISLDMPSTPSTKGLALNFFNAVDEALDTDFYEQWKDKSHYSVERHLSQMQSIAVAHHLGLAHIDELQFMLKYKNSKNAPSFTTIEALFNKLGIPIVLSSTTSGREMFLSDTKSPDFTITRRLLTNREYQFSLYGVKSKFFNSLFDALFPESFCKSSEMPDKQFKQVFCYLTCGLPAMMTRLAILHHESIAMLKNKYPDKADTYRTGDVERLHKTYNNQFSLIAGALDNLRAGNIQQFDEDVNKLDEKEHVLTNEEVKLAAKAKRKKVQKLLPDVVPDPLGIPRVCMDIDSKDMLNFIKEGYDE